jgi:hypothetical protein
MSNKACSSASSAMPSIARLARASASSSRHRAASAGVPRVKSSARTGADGFHVEPVHRVSLLPLPRRTRACRAASRAMRSSRAVAARSSSAVEGGAIVVGELDQTGFLDEAAQLYEMARAFAALHDPSLVSVRRCAVSSAASPAPAPFPFAVAARRIRPCARALKEGGAIRAPRLLSSTLAMRRRRAARRPAHRDRARRPRWT